MSDGKNTLRLLGDHINFNLNHHPITFDTQKNIYTKKTVPATFDCLVSFIPSDISVRRKI